MVKSSCLVHLSCSLAFYNMSFSPLPTESYSDFVKIGLNEATVMVMAFL